MVQAVIYCRVSSDKQVLEGNGIKSQEQRCRQYAEMKGYKVREVFAEEGVSGKLFKRPEMDRLVDYLNLHATKENPIIVIFDDLKRFGRETENHFPLKLRIIQANGKLESPGFRFEDTPESKFIETILVAQGTLEREQNAVQVTNKMKARLEMGYWPFPGFPRCFNHKSLKGMGKVLVHNQNAPVYKEVLEGYAFDRFHTLADAHKWFVDQGIKSEYSKFCVMVRNPLLAGYLEYPKWKVGFRKAQHQEIISLELHQRIITKILGKGPNQVHVKTKLNEDFPLRGYVKCVETESKFTGGWTKNGNGIRKPYYQARVTRDQREEKGFRSRSFQRDLVHARLEKELEKITPKTNLLELTRAIFSDCWDTKTNEIEKASKQDNTRLKQIEDEFESILDKLTKTTSDLITKVYEKKLEDLEKEKTVLTQNLDSKKLTPFDFQTALENVLNFIKNVGYYWKNGNADAKKTILKLCFQDYLYYSENFGFQTPKYSLPFKLFRSLGEGESPLVEVGGIAPPSSWDKLVMAVSGRTHIRFGYFTLIG